VYESAPVVYHRAQFKSPAKNAQMRKLVLILALAAAGTLPACYYKMDIQQGNVITQEMVDQVQTGMTKRQVSYVLGTPLVNDPFHLDRWDYVYTLRKGGKKEVERRNLTLFFSDETLTRIERQGLGDGPPKEELSGATLSADDTVVVKGDAKEVEKTTGKKEKGLLRRTWDKIQIWK